MTVRLRDDNPDEVLYHARIHPEQRCNSLSEEQTEALHREISRVCTFAVKVNADHTKFPDNWLFKHRWVKSHLSFLLFQGLVLTSLKGKGQKSEGKGRLDTETGEHCGCRICTPRRECRAFSQTVNQRLSSGSPWAAVLQRTL